MLTKWSALYPFGVGIYSKSDYKHDRVEHNLTLIKQASVKNKLNMY